MSLEKVLDQVDGDGKPDPVRLHQFHAHDAESIALFVDQRSSTISWIHGGVCLKVALSAQIVFSNGGYRTPTTANLGNDLGQSRPSDLHFLPKGKSVNENRLARFYRLRVSERNVREIPPVDRKNRQIELRVYGVDGGDEAASLPHVTPASRRKDDFHSLHLDPDANLGAVNIQR